LLYSLPYWIVEADFLQLRSSDIGSALPRLRIDKSERRSDEQRMVDARKELTVLESRNDRQCTRIIGASELLYALTDIVKAWRGEKGVGILRLTPGRAPQREKQTEEEKRGPADHA